MRTSGRFDRAFADFAWPITAVVGLSLGLVPSGCVADPGGEGTAQAEQDLTLRAQVALFSQAVQDRTVEPTVSIRLADDDAAMKQSLKNIGVLEHRIGPDLRDFVRQQLMDVIDRAFAR